MPRASFLLLAGIVGVAVAEGDAQSAALCGNATKPLTASKLNVLILGDSISMTPPYTPGGYGGALEKLLAPVGIVAQHAGGEFGGGQCGDTREGLVCTNASNPLGYLPESFKGTFDLISFKCVFTTTCLFSCHLVPLSLSLSFSHSAPLLLFQLLYLTHASFSLSPLPSRLPSPISYGLHDLADYGPALPQLPVNECALRLTMRWGATQYHPPHILSSLCADAANIVTIYKRLRARAKKVMWTTTSPCPDVPTSYGRTYDLPVEYNAHALAALKASLPAGEEVLVNDLWTAMIGKCGVRYKTCALQLPANVHLSVEGIAFAAGTTAKAIRAALGV